MSTATATPETTPAQNAVVALPAPRQERGLLDKISAHYSVAPDVFRSTMKAVAMPQPHTAEELISCLIVAWEHKLNPLTKEIYFMRTKAGAIQPIVGVDGWIRKLNEHPMYDGLEFEFGPIGADGTAQWCEVVIEMNNRKRAIKVREWLEECRKAGGPVWRTSPMRMLRNRTLCQGARIAVGFAGVMSPDEFEDWQSREREPQTKQVAAAPLPDLLAIPDPAAENRDVDQSPVIEGEVVTDNEVDDDAIADPAGTVSMILDALREAHEDERQDILDSYESVINRLPAEHRAMIDRWLETGEA